jgi:hypothetical protein
VCVCVCVCVNLIILPVPCLSTPSLFSVPSICSFYSLFLGKVKVKLSLCFFSTSAPRHEGMLESGGSAPRILDFGIIWRWVVSFTPRLLYPQGKSPWYPLDRRLGGPQNRSESGGEEKNSQPLPGIEHPIIQPVAQRYTTELSRLMTVPKFEI